MRPAIAGIWLRIAFCELIIESLAPVVQWIEHWPSKPRM